jgi:hypothetical protein
VVGLRAGLKLRLSNGTNVLIRREAVPISGDALGPPVRLLAAQAIQHDPELSSAEKCRRVARRMSLVTCSAGFLVVVDLWVIFVCQRRSKNQPDGGAKVGQWAHRL